MTNPSLNMARSQARYMHGRLYLQTYTYICRYYEENIKFNFNDDLLKGVL